MTLHELNKEYNDLKNTAECLGKAMKKFEGHATIENYLSYDILYRARECVISAMDRFINRDWK